MFVIIGRTFFSILKRENTESGRGDLSTNEQTAEKAKRCIDITMEGIQDYITNWERRNFTTDNRLTSSLRAGKSDDCYSSVSTLLKAMIDVVSPSGVEPYSSSFRKHALYEPGLYLNTKCKHGQREHCILGSFCPREIRSRVREDDVRVCLKYVEALRVCASISERQEMSALDDALEEAEFHAETWNSNCSYSSIHRIETLADFVRSKMKETSKSPQMVSLFVQEVRTDVARCWGALGRSNARATLILDSLQLGGSRDTRETIVELIFGGGIGATALFEREKEVIAICGKLRSKKGPHVLMMNEGTSADENELLEQDIHMQRRDGLGNKDDGGTANKKNTVHDRPTVPEPEKEFPDAIHATNRDPDEKAVESSSSSDPIHDAMNHSTPQTPQQQPVKKRKRRGVIIHNAELARKVMMPPKRKSRRRKL